MLNMAARPRPLSDELSDQLGFVDCSAKTRALAEYIVHNLDDAGFLRLDLAEIARDFGGVATVEEAEEALQIVQRLDPAGIGARDLRECLLLQLTPDLELVDVMRVLISDHLTDIQQNRLPQIEKRTGFSIETIKEALEHLRRLDPRPGARYVQDDNQFVVPDLLVEADEHGEYHVRLVDEHTPNLGISRAYQRMLKNKSEDPAAREFIQKKIQSARWLIESIEQRRNTLLKVARAIIAHQKDFLDKGPESIQPLKMQQIADQVGVHVTTVSRAVDDKWVQTPRGIFALKRFFGGGTTTADGEEVAWDSIKQKLLEVIAKEDKSSPMSDEEIVDELGRSGLPVARRTVTKYRKALKIPSSRQRRQF
jgi:RNA polymerase sigma-54 factor